MPPFFSSGWRSALLLAGLLAGHAAQAQVDTYTFTPSSGTFTALPTATNVAVIQDDDALSGTIPLGFTFVFDGTPYTSCKVSSNGWLTFNATTTDNNRFNDLATGDPNNRPLVGPFWDDLDGTGGTASYLTSGTAPNRTFTFEWKTWSLYGNTGGPSFSMQAQLVEGTNVVRFVYTQLAGTPVSGASASIGLSGVGTGPGSFLALSDATASATASSTTENSNIAIFPPTGQVYTFTPSPPALCPTPRNLAVTSVTTTSATVTYTVTNATPGPFTIAYGPTGFNPAQSPSPANAYTTTTAAGTTATLPGLAASTAYDFYVTQNCGTTAGNSGRSIGSSFLTACLPPPYAGLPVTESFENTWLSRCGTNDVPTTNWRNTPVTGDNSWRRDDNGASANWTNPASWSYTPTGSLGTHSARFHTGQAADGQIGALDLFVNLSPAGAKRLSFDFINTSGTDSLLVQLSTNGGLTFAPIAGYNLSTGAGFSSQVLSIGATSTTAVIRFSARSDFGLTDIGLDNIVLESATGCLTPAALTATTTTTTAALSWLAGGTGTYTVVYGPTGFNPAQPASSTNVYTTATGLTAPPYTLTGLAPGTTYQFYVTANCGASTNSGTAGPQSFTTQLVNDEPCGATVLAINNTCNPLTTTTIGATPTATAVYGTGGQGTSCGFNTTPHDVWFRFTTAATGPTSTAVRISVTGNAASVISAYSGAACAGPLTYLACSGGATNTTASDLDLSSLTPSTVYYVRISEYEQFNYTLGSFTICAVPVPNCPAPTGLATGAITNTSAVLTWSAPASAGSTYTVFYGPMGFVPPTGTGSSTLTGLTAPTTTITNLQPSTPYQFYVQQICGGLNGSSTLVGPFAFTTLQTVPANDEPCAAVGLGAGVRSSTNVGATTSTQPGIITPACSPAALPKDVWFAFTASGSSATLTLTGAPAGMVRVFTSPSCSAGPFAQVLCQGSGTSNTSVGTVTVPGLSAGQRYYVAVSGYGSSDVAGPFTIAATGVLSARAQAETDALRVYPNPSSTGQLTLQLSRPGSHGQATLLNALGQVVLTQTLAATAEQSLRIRGLATGVYTLRVETNGQVLTRKVVLE